MKSPEHGRAIRDSKHPEDGAPLLTVSRETWRSFVRHL
ncbi:DUF397 domain-containing protein [Streptomyces sp. NBC_00989]|nr:DUF397 domain-containing protein [Streptomyces sp. NBC_00989]